MKRFAQAGRQGQWIVVLAVAMMVIGAADARADSWQVVYQTDFSTDPEWFTNNPTRYYWDSDQTYRVRNVNINYGGYFGLYDVGTNSGSFQLGFDVYVSSADYASALVFGMYGDDPESDGHGSFVQIYFAREDRGLTVVMQAIGENNVYKTDWDAHVHYDLETWYRVVMTYDEAVHSLTADVYLREVGTHWGTLSIIGLGEFAADMTWLGSSNLRNHGTFQCPGHEAVGQFDNVHFSVAPVPEPATMLLLGSGLVGLVGFRKRFRKR